MSAATFLFRGSVLAWSGRDAPGERGRAVMALGDSAVFVSRSKLHQYLSVGVRRGGLWVVASVPLELRYPISNKFVEEVSFAEEASRAIGRRVEIVLESSRSDVSTHAAVRVPLQDGRGGVLGFCLIAEPTMENGLERTNAGFTPLLALLAGLAVFSGLWVSLAALRNRTSAWLEALAVSLLIWGARGVLLVLDFPKALVPKELFDASRYGAPFVLGLSSSPGDTLLSALALLGTLGAIYVAIRRSPGAPGMEARPRWQRLAAGCAVAFSVVASIVSTRANGAAVHSFVFDSSIRYDEPSTLVPDPVALVMLGSLLALTRSLIV